MRCNAHTHTHTSRRTREKDLGLTFTESLLPEKYLNKIIGETYNLLRNSIGVAFVYLDEDMIRIIIVAVIYPKLEYAAVVWSPWL